MRIKIFMLVLLSSLAAQSAVSNQLMELYRELNYIVLGKKFDRVTPYGGHIAVHQMHSKLSAITVYRGMTNMRIPLSRSFSYMLEIKIPKESDGTLFDIFVTARKKDASELNEYKKALEEEISEIVSRNPGFSSYNTSAHLKEVEKEYKWGHAYTDIQQDAEWVGREVGISLKSSVPYDPGQVEDLIKAIVTRLNDID